jgi:hypothetical protein
MLSPTLAIVAAHGYAARNLPEIAGKLTRATSGPAPDIACLE